MIKLDPWVKRMSTLARWYTRMLFKESTSEQRSDQVPWIPVIDPWLGRGLYQVRPIDHGLWGTVW